MYIYDRIEKGEKKLEDFEDRFEYLLISEMQYTNNYYGKLFDMSKLDYKS